MILFFCKDYEPSSYSWNTRNYCLQKSFDLGIYWIFYPLSCSIYETQSLDESQCLDAKR